MRFNRLINMIGEEKFQELKNKKIIVFGLGGVGSFAAEAIVRSGIGNLDVVDYDIVDETNINRQLIALSSTVGKYKTDIVKARALDINPKLNIKTVKLKADAESIQTILSPGYDAVIDCIDDLSAKVELAKYCIDNRINFIASMGFANKFHPELIKIKKMNQTSVCPLAKAMRRELRIAGYSLDFKVAFSEEKPAKVIDKNTLRSNSYCPSAAGLIIAAQVINEMIGEEK